MKVRELGARGEDGAEKTNAELRMQNGESRTNGTRAEEPQTKADGRGQEKGT